MLNFIKSIVSALVQKRPSGAARATVHNVFIETRLALGRRKQQQDTLPIVILRDCWRHEGSRTHWDDALSLASPNPASLPRLLAAKAAEGMLCQCFCSNRWPPAALGIQVPKMQLYGSAGYMESWHELTVLWIVATEPDIQQDNALVHWQIDLQKNIPSRTSDLSTRDAICLL